MSRQASKSLNLYYTINVLAPLGRICTWFADTNAVLGDAHEVGPLVDLLVKLLMLDTYEPLDITHLAEIVSSVSPDI